MFEENAMIFLVVVVILGDCAQFYYLQYITLFFSPPDHHTP